MFCVIKAKSNKEALEYHTKVLAVVEKEYGRDDVEEMVWKWHQHSLIWEVHTIGKASMTRQSIHTIEPWSFAKRFAKQEKLGLDHISTAETHMGIAIAIVLDDQEKYDKAMEGFSKILPIYEKK